MSAYSFNPIVADLAAFDDRVLRMSGTLTCDFADSGVGERYIGYEHRTRVLRQFTAWCDSIRDAAIGPAVQA